MPDPNFSVQIKKILGHFIAFLSGFCLRHMTGHIFIHTWDQASKKIAKNTDFPQFFALDRYIC
jgi:hypothetical protein